MSTELIAIDRVVKRYGPVVALAGISLDVCQGEFLAVLGPSGCGKTTLLRVLAGFAEPTSGEIRIDGQVMTGVPPNRRPVNTVFQNYALFPHLSVAENIAFGPKRRGMSAGKVAPIVEEAMTLVGMGGLGARMPAQLSGGQQQRVALARAIVNRPKVLLLDEPLGALDLKLRKRMQIELKRLQERLEITFIFVTHDQEEALVMADRIVVMDEGHIMQVGSGAEIYGAPRSRFVAEFIGDANFLPCRGEHGRAVLAGAGAALLCPLMNGNTATLMVRPEDVGLGEGTGEVVRLLATVRERVFIGDATRIHLVLDDGLEIIAQPSRGPVLEGLRPGERVTIHWRPDRARLLDT
jgi:spermidine/putrescine transport system ATP-binding protein